MSKPAKRTHSRHPGANPWTLPANLCRPGSRTKYRYDTNAWLLDRPERVLITDENGQWVKETRFAYDSLGRLTNDIRYLEPALPVVVARIEYDPYGNAIRRTDARGYSITNSFDPVFHTFPVTESVEVGNGTPPLETRAEYDPRFGNTLRVFDFNGNESSMQYDSFGRLVFIVLPGDSVDLPTKSFKYVIADDLRGWLYDYDSDGQLTRTTGLLPGSITSRIHSYQRERFGQTAVIESVSYIDGLGRVLSSQVQDEGGFTVTAATLFNTRGGERAKFLPHPSTGSFLADTNIAHSDLAYDAPGRALRVTLPPDQQGTRHFTRTEYLPLKTVAFDFEDTVVGGPHENTPTTTIKDGLGRLLQLIEVNQQGAATGPYVTTYAYNLQDNLLRSTDAQGNVKTNAFDGWGRKTATHDPNKGYFRYFYDPVGNLLATVDAKSQTNSYTYDGANRILTEDYGADGVNDAVYHYDTVSRDYPAMQNLQGEIAFIEDQSGACFYSYDARGNVLKKVKRVIRRSRAVEDYTFASRYDAADRMFEATFPDGDRVYYEFNRRGLLSAVPGIVNSLHYNAAAQRTTMTCANGVTTTFTYDPRQRLRSLLTTSPSAGIIQHLTYMLDGANNMLAMTDGRGLAPSDPRNMNQTFAMDDIYRLTQANGTGYGILNYAYDKLGNMTSQSSPNITDPQVNHGTRAFGGLAGASNRAGRNRGDAPGPHALSGTASGYAIAYDDNGNMLTARGNTYSWDSLDRLATVVSTNGTTRFVYDYSGSRVLKFTEEDAASEVVYLSGSYEIRDGKSVKFIFAGPVRAARVEGPLPVPSRVTRYEVLHPGWNLVPIAVQLTNQTPADVFSTIAGAYTSIHRNTPTGILTFVPGQTGNTLSSIAEGSAYWVNASRTCTLTLDGAPYAPASMSLSAGWQPVVFSRSLPLADLAATNPNVSAAWTFDNFLKQRRHFHANAPPAVNSLSVLGGDEPALLQCLAPTTLFLSEGHRRVFFYHADHLGSGNVVTDEAGSIVEELYYYPFGLLRHRYAPGGSGYTSEYTFSDKERDPESGLSYFGARYYDSMFCVFINVDPVAMHNPERSNGNSQRLNAYAYAGNSPLVLVDPDGQFVWVIAAVAISAVANGVMAELNGGNFFQGFLIGAVAGAVGGGIGLGAGALIAEAGLTGACAVGAASVGGIAAGYGAKQIASVLSGRGFTSFSLGEAMTSGVTAGLGAGLGTSALTGFRAFSGDLLVGGVGMLAGAAVDGKALTWSDAGKLLASATISSTVRSAGQAASRSELSRLQRKGEILGRYGESEMQRKSAIDYAKRGVERDLAKVIGKINNAAGVAATAAELPSASPSADAPSQLGVQKPVDNPPAWAERVWFPSGPLRPGADGALLRDSEVIFFEGSSVTPRR